MLYLCCSSITKTTFPRNLALRRHIWCWNKVSLLVISLHVHLLCWDCANSQTGLLFSVSMCQSHKWFRLADFIRLWVSTIIKTVFCPLCLIIKLLTEHLLTKKRNFLERSDISLVLFIVRKIRQEIKWLDQSHNKSQQNVWVCSPRTPSCHLSFWYLYKGYVYESRNPYFQITKWTIIFSSYISILVLI